VTTATRKLWSAAPAVSLPVVGEAIGQILPLAVGVALSPIPIIAVVLMLGTPKGSANGSAFVLGWIVGLSLAGAIVLLISSGANASDEGAPADWVGWLKIALGLTLLAVAVRQWRSRPHGGERTELPKWMQTIDRFTPGRSVAMAVALSAINPKNLLLVVGAAAAIAQTGIDSGEQAVALAVFVVIATLGPGLPVAIYFTMRARSERMLATLEDWMAGNNAAIMAVLCLIIAAKLVGDGISGLTASG
jgi:threonine/homoserine/homoserine lactone efflux protein